MVIAKMTHCSGVMDRKTPRLAAVAALAAPTADFGAAPFPSLAVVAPAAVARRAAFELVDWYPALRAAWLRAAWPGLPAPPFPAGLRAPCFWFAIYSNPSPAWTAGEVHTAAGAFFVILQMAAVIEFAALSMSAATLLLGSAMSAATWDQVSFDRSCGLYWAPRTRYWLPKSTKGNEPFSFAGTYGGASHLANSADCSAVGVCSAFPSVVPWISTGWKSTYLLV